MQAITMSNSTIRLMHIEILKECQKLCADYFRASFSSLFDKIDNVLLDFADKAETNQKQAMFFEGKTEIFRKQLQIEHSFYNLYNQRFNSYISNQTRSSMHEQAAVKPQAHDFQLVKQHDMEINIVTSSAITRQRQQCYRQIFELEKRLGYIKKCDIITEKDNPFSPESLCDYFCKASSVLDIALEVRLIILVSFERFFLKDYAYLYDALNQKLIDNDVLPHFKYAVKKHSATQSDTHTSEQPPTTSEPVAQNNPRQQNSAAFTDNAFNPASNHSAESLEAEIFNHIKHILVEKRKQHKTATSLKVQPTTVARPQVTTHDLLDVVSAAQHAQPTHLYHSDDIDQKQLSQQLGQERQHIVEQVEKSNQSVGVNTEIIELVGMLFDYMLKDKDIPDRIKALLSLLHTPYLKVALLNTEFFSKKTNPPRQLFDNMIRIASAWHADRHFDSLIYPKMRHITDAIVEQFETDLGLFKRFNQEFLDLISTLEKRAMISESRSRQASEGQDKLRTARKYSLKIITEHLTGLTISTPICQFLEKSWLNVMVFVLLRDGEESTQWQTTLKLLDKILWTVQRHDHKSERLRVKHDIPEIEKQLSQQLVNYCGYHQGQVHQTLQQLQSEQEKALMLLPLDEKELNNADKFPLSTHTEHNDSELTFDQNSESGKQIIATLQQLSIGTWFEFIEGTNTRKAKLSWLSSQNKTYLFVEHNGTKIQEKSWQQLAIELQQKTAIILKNDPDSSFIERALNSIMDFLKGR